MGDEFGVDAVGDVIDVAQGCKPVPAVQEFLVDCAEDMETLPVPGRKAEAAGSAVIFV